MSRRADHKPYKSGKERERSRSPRASRSSAGSEAAAVAVAAASAEEQRRPENIALSARDRLKSMGNQMKLNSARLGAAQAARPKLSVATAFNQDSDDEPEEMPPEAKMRMRNIGRDTPTSSGPNSFGKTKQGFLDEKNVFDKKLRAAMESYMQEQISPKPKVIQKCTEKK